MSRAFLPALAAALLSGCTAIPFDAPPGPHAGQGDLTITPSRLEASQEEQLEIFFTPGPAGLVQGGGFRLELPVDPVHPFLGFSPPQSTSAHLTGHARCVTRRGGRFGDDAVTIAGPGGQVGCLLATGRLAQGEALGLALRAMAPRVSGRFALHAESRHSGAWGGRRMAAAPVIEVLPRRARTLMALQPASVQPARPFQLTLAALDEFGNRAPGYRGLVEARWGSWARRHRFTPDDEGVARVACPAAPASGVVRVTVTELEGQMGLPLVVRSNPSMVLPEAEGRLLWGDLHAHTGPGAGAEPSSARIDEALGYARDVMRLDFAAVIRQADRPPAPDSGAVAAGALPASGDLAGFIPIGGIQLGGRLLLAADHDRRLVISLAGRPGGDASEIYSWSNRGSGYVDRPFRFEPGPGWLDDEGRAPIPRAVTAGSSNHWGRPGTLDVTGLEPGSGGLTGVRAHEPGAAGILAALSEGEAWATTGARILLLPQRRGDLLQVAAAGTGEIARLEMIFVSARAVRVEPLPGAEGPDLVRTIRIDFGPGERFCYLRLTQQDGQVAWSGPIPRAGRR